MELAIAPRNSDAVDVARSEPLLSGALDGLKLLSVDDYLRYQLAVEAGKQESWGYYFPFLLTCTRPGRSAMLMAEDNDSICIFRWRLRNGRPKLEIMLAPTPMDPAVLRRCIERANDFNADRSARVLRVDSKDTAAVEAAGLRVRSRKEQYVYAPENYRQLSGKKLYTVRRNVAFVEKLPDVEVRPFAPEHDAACRRLLSRWRDEHRARHGTLGGVGTSRRALDLASILPAGAMRGEVVLVDGQLAAFSLGGQIRSGLACYFERKCDSAIRGLSYFSLRSFLLKLEDFEFVNDSSDAGRAGLRQLKHSFRPVRMHIEYRGTQRR